jgi:hypothetical protein
MDRIMAGQNHAERRTGGYFLMILSFPVAPLPQWNQNDRQENEVKSHIPVFNFPVLASSVSPAPGSFFAASEQLRLLQCKEHKDKGMWLIPLGFRLTRQVIA